MPAASTAAQIVVIDFVTMAMTLGDLRAVDLCGQRAGLDRAGLRAQAHGAAEIGIDVALFDLAVVILPFVDQGHHRLLGLRIEFGAVGARQAGTCRARYSITATCMPRQMPR